MALFTDKAPFPIPEDEDSETVPVVEQIVSTNQNNLPTDDDLINAKGFLSIECEGNNGDVYSHMSEIIKYIMTYRPTDPLSNFETISEEIKRSKFKSADWSLYPMRDVQTETTEMSLAKVHKRLFPKRKVPEEDEDAKKQEEDDDDDDGDDDDAESPLPNMLEMVFYFEQAGVGLARDEMLKLWSSMKKFSKTKPVAQIRFWGKIFGLEENYYILEVELEEDEPEEEEEAKEEAPADDEKETAAEEGEENKVEEDPLPKNKWKPPPVVPPEERGSGVNKPIFFATNTLGTAWRRLPDLKPQQITVARNIRKFFTGRFDASVVSFPPYPGKEINLLRAQIARIHSSTLISPVGFYEVDEEEDLEEDAIPQTLITAEEFDEVDIDELCDPSLAGWVHHGLYILPQGRCQWIDAKKAAKEASEEEAPEEEEEEEEEEVEPEEPVPLLTGIGDDEPLPGTTDELTTWRVEKAGKMVPKYAICALHSNLWPGAHTFASGKKFENVYIGWGLKYSSENHQPLQLPRILNEFNDTGDAELTEAVDPTPAEEAALREMLRKKEEVKEEGEEQKEEGGGGEEEEEEED